MAAGTLQERPAFQARRGVSREVRPPGSPTTKLYNGANTFKLPSYTVSDAETSYDFGAVSQKLKGAKLAVNATSIADKKDVAGCSTRRNVASRRFRK